MPREKVAPFGSRIETKIKQQARENICTSDNG